MPWLCDAAGLEGNPEKSGEPDCDINVATFCNMFAVAPLWFASVHKKAQQCARLRVPLRGAPCLVVSLVLCLCLAFALPLPCL